MYWINDQDVLRATAATRGWNGYRHKSQHRKLTLEKKILPPLLSGLEPATFESRVRRSTTELSLLPTLQSTTVLDNVLSTASCHLLTINQNHTCMNRNRPYLPALAWQRTETFCVPAHKHCITGTRACLHKDGSQR